MIETIRKVPNALLRVALLKKLAEEIRLPEAALAAELERQGAGVHSLLRAGEAKSQPAADEGYVPMIERILIGLFLTFPTCAERAKTVVKKEDFRNARARSVAEMILESGGEEGFKPAQFLNRIQSDQQTSHLVTASIHEVENIGDYEKAFKDCLTRLEEARQKTRSDYLRKEIGLAEVRGDREKVRELLQEFSQRSKRTRES